jgi:hypothetical protein
MGLRHPLAQRPHDVDHERELALLAEVPGVHQPPGHRRRTDREVGQPGIVVHHHGARIGEAAGHRLGGGDDPVGAPVGQTHQQPRRESHHRAGDTVQIGLGVDLPDQILVGVVDHCAAMKTPPQQSHRDEFRIVDLQQPGTKPGKRSPGLRLAEHHPAQPPAGAVQGDHRDAAVVAVVLGGDHQVKS